MELKVIFKPQLEHKGYTVRVPSLPGCISQGETKEEAIKNIKEAIELYLEATNLPKKIKPYNLKLTFKNK